MKAYRLINAFELNQLREEFKQTITEWNDQYSYLPLSIELKLPSKEYNTDHLLELYQTNSAIAFIKDSYHELINHSLFGEHHSCFNEVSEELFLRLLQQLLKTETSNLKHENQNKPSWIYPGSTCLILELKCKTYQVSLILNPEWVYQYLALNKNSNQKLCSLDRALSNEQISLSIVLIPLRLTMNELMNLQIGDVISSDHPITKQVNLQHQEQLLAYAELGQSSNHKSIILKESQ